MTRVAVFVDYQNLYHGARRAFGDPRSDPPTFGHVRPDRLGLLLKQLGEVVDPERELVRITVFRGQPGAKGHPHLQSAFARQVDAWRELPLTIVKTRPLRYQPTEWSFGRPIRWRGEEKGVDVLIALDVALGARDDCYDVAVVVSADTDLIPAIEIALQAGKRVETATWASQACRIKPLMIEGRRTWNHWLDRQRFEYVRDYTNYLTRSRS
ncbi:MAG: NYN domain-containing protein [Gammaproteobacteria bacterium]|nr:NYN domain-containing protein [Gammaproteobacteria bacterium]MCY3650623.1 NYN domain-containing protein [Acidimicrobiaceae bacterium]MDE0514713.1 NYN domain-containing protein [Acidimicrobiaceae bacterium]MDE0656724.1 NYN domain-containing protein [Acidimicrobiaceae bacterium]